MVFIYASKMHDSQNEQSKMRHNLFGESCNTNMICAQFTAENGAHVE